MIDKGKRPMVVDDLAPKMKKSSKCNGKPKGSKPVEENPISNDGSDTGQSAKAERKIRRWYMNREKLLSLQGKVQENISMLHQSSIFATIIGEPMEAKDVRKRMRDVWKSLSSGFQLIPIANNWFELRFDLVEDRTWVWDNHPFHVSGQLIILRPWRLDFDPWIESITLLDLWIGFPGLPAKYVHEKILRDIVKANKLGSVIKVFAFNAKGARFRYPRVCVLVDITKISGRELFVVNESSELESYPMWFEDFPLGCGSCGASDHLFEACPIRNLCNLGANIGPITDL